MDLKVLEMKTCFGCTEIELWIWLSGSLIEVEVKKFKNWWRRSWIRCWSKIGFWSFNLFLFFYFLLWFLFFWCLRSVCVRYTAQSSGTYSRYSQIMYQSHFNSLSLSLSNSIRTTHHADLLLSTPKHIPLSLSLHQPK